MTQAMTLAARIVRALHAKNYPVDTGAGEITIAYVRGLEPNGVANDNAPNAFNDLRVLIRFEAGEPKIVRAWAATVEPGRKYVLDPVNPKGAAFIVDGHYRAWQVGVHRGHHLALIQTGGPVTVSRDKNKDFNPAGDALDPGWHGINQHGGYEQPLNDIGGASAGCLVVPAMRDQAEFMRLVRTDPRWRADRGFVFATAVLSAADVLADGPYVAPAETSLGTTLGVRVRMARAIVEFEARRDRAGRLQVYVPPGNDGGGAYEIAGINVRYHPRAAQQLKALIEAGAYEEAERAAVEYVLRYTDVVIGWAADPGAEFYLRDCAFNRGPTGAARILQRAVGVAEDGVVGPRTRAAAAVSALLPALRAAREAYERAVVGERANMWDGLVNRWEHALAVALTFEAVS